MDGVEAVQSRSNVHHWPGTAVNQIESPVRFWLLRATDWIGITMKTETPSGWSFNPATVTLALVVAGGILTGGYLWGENVTERRHLLQRIEQAEKDAAEAKKFSIYATAGADEASGHKPEPKEKQK